MPELATIYITKSDVNININRIWNYFFLLKSKTVYSLLGGKLFSQRKWNNFYLRGQIRSDQISHSVVSDSLRPHESQHARPPCPSPTPGIHPDSHPTSQWCHPAISSSVVPFSSCPQSLPASESFPISQLFAWGGQSTKGDLKNQSYSMLY